MFIPPNLTYVLARSLMPMLKIISILGLILFVYFGYKHIQNKFIELDNAKIVMSKQSDKIADLQIEIIKSKESSKVTVQAISNVVVKQEELKKKTIEKVIYVKESIQKIDDSLLLKEEKELQKSIVYINDLYDTYCIVDSENCPSDKKVTL